MAQNTMDLDRTEVKHLWWRKGTENYYLNRVSEGRGMIPDQLNYSLLLLKWRCRKYRKVITLNGHMNVGMGK